MTSSRTFSASSGDDDGDPEVVRREHLRHTPPDNELPFPVAVQVVLARTDDVAVAVTGLEAYSCGLALTVSVRRRAGAPGGADALNEAVFGCRGSSGLMLGVEFADGRRTSTTRGWAEELATDEPVLTGRGGGADDRTADQAYWLHPLPPPGDLLVVVASPSLGVDETRTVLEVGPFLAAAARAVELWPWAPPDEPSWDDDAPELPEGSWFRPGG